MKITNVPYIGLIMFFIMIIIMIIRIYFGIGTKPELGL